MSVESSVDLPVPRPFGDQLRQWRRHRGFSQLHLALEAGVSSRHLSFLETGRSQPSRKMVVRLLDTLEVPLRERNTLLLAAGFAPAYGERSLDDPEMTRTRNNIDFLLRAHNPYPAFVLDRCWNILLGNETHINMLAALLGGADKVPVRPNALRLVFDPELLRPVIANWPIVAAHLLQRLARQLEEPAANDALRALYHELLDLPGVRTAVDEAAPHIDRQTLLVPLEIETEQQKLSWVSTLARFGTALDVTLQEIVIECQYPADAATERFARDFAARSGGG